jgi:transposase InsO family protein
MVKPAGRREVVRHYQEVFALSERRACRAMGFGRASHRYQSRRDPAMELRMRLKELAESRVRYGYRRLHVLLQRDGWQVKPQADLPALLRRRSVDPDPKSEAPASVPLPVGAIRGQW